MKRWVSLVLALMLLVVFATPVNAAVTLEVGSKGENVRKVQQKLIGWGYLKGTADGIYGADTKAAVIKFQKSNGLTADGKVGAATAKAMGVTLTGSSSSSSASSASAKSAAITSSDHSLLAKLVYAEARGEPYKGQVAVAAVVLNRVRSSQFPNTISGVIYQKNAFSCVSNGTINRTPNNDAIRAARDAMNGWDPTGGCLYFYNPKQTSDAWIRSRTTKTVIGNHRFAA